MNYVLAENHGMCVCCMAPPWGQDSTELLFFFHAALLHQHVKLKRHLKNTDFTHDEGPRHPLVGTPDKLFLLRP